MAYRHIQKWHYDAAAAIFDRLAAALHAAGVSLSDADRAKMIGAVAADIMKHEPPEAVTVAIVPNPPRPLPDLIATAAE